MRDSAMPGHLLAEELKERGITLTEFIEQTGLDVMGIIQGKRVLSGTDARKLSEALGTSAMMWLKLDDAYRETR